MIDRDDIAQKLAVLMDLLQQKHGVKARDFRKAVKRTGRRLPKRLRAEADHLLRAQAAVENPQLAVQFDTKAVERSFQAIKAHLEEIDVTERRKDRVLNLAALLAFQFLVIFALFVWFLWWRGYV